MNLKTIYDDFMEKRMLSVAYLMRKYKMTIEEARACLSMIHTNYLKAEYDSQGQIEKVYF